MDLRSLLVVSALACGSACTHTQLDRGPAQAPVPTTPVVDPVTDSAPRLSYPNAPSDAVVDVLHGVSVADPYRPLEDVDAPATRSWIDAENRLTAAFLQAIPERAAIGKRLTEVWNFERYGVPHRRGGRYFVSRNDGLQNQSVVHWTDALDGELRVLLDPNTLSDDGTIALSGTAVSHDGKLLAYGLSSSGSDWQTWRVRDVETGKDRSDVLEWIKFSEASWSADNKGFYYSRYAAPGSEGGKFEDVNYHQKLYYHELGKPQSADRLVYERPDHKEWGFDGNVTDDGKFLVIHVRVGTDPKNGIFYQALKGQRAGKTVELLGDFDAEYDFIDNDGPVLLFKTNLGAERSRVIAIDTRRPGREHWKELIPEAADTLVAAKVVGGRIFANYLKDAYSQIKIFGLDGRFERDLSLPGLGTVDRIEGERKGSEAFFAYGSFTAPDAVYRYEIEQRQLHVYKQPKVAFDVDAFETSQVFVTSKDGTRVPMFLVHARGLDRKRVHPTYLYGYGGFAIPLTPKFSPANLVWMELGGILAIPNLRGGGEYGEAWHRAGTKLDKQNVFDDFIAAAEWLIDNRYTAREKLAIGGRSNGGLLVGAAMTQRPDLFGAALPGVGVMDMLRFHKFTIGWAWTSDYGTPDDPQQFEALHAYSPYHNLREGTHYPATLVYTADHDDRVVPGHSFKFAARLQASQAGDAPVLIRIDTKAGHGAGKPTTKMIEEWTDLWGFLVASLDMKAPASFGTH